MQESAIKKFLAEVLHRGGEKPLKRYAPDLVDISDPHAEDLQKISQTDYEITNLRTVKRPDGKIDYHFYVGRTEFHIKGEAADGLSELMAE